MFAFAERLKLLQPSPTLALNAKAKKLQAEGKKIINFSAGEPDFNTPTSIVSQAIESLNKGRTRYGTPGGGLPLKEAISQKLANENKLDFTAEQIVVGIGVKEILFHTFLALLNDGDEVLLLAPYWVSYADQIQIAGGKPVIVPAPKDIKQGIDFEALKNKISTKTKAIVLNSPNNPAGNIFSKAQLEQLGEICSKHNFWILSDEIYEYLSFTSPHLSLINICPQLKDRFVLFNGLSKGFAMTGWRVGYAAGPTPLIKLITGLQSHSSTCLPGFIEDAACFALKQGKNLMSKEIESLDQRRKCAVELIQKIPNLEIWEPNGAFYIMVGVHKYLQNTKKLPSPTSLAFSEYLLDSYGVAAVPGEAFGAPGFIRISYTVSLEQITIGINLLATALSQLSTPSE